MRARIAAGVVAGAVASLLGGLILGEYEFSGAMPFVAGALVGLVVSEIVIEVGGARSWVVGLAAAAVVVAGLGLAGWRAKLGVRPFPALAWAAMAIGGLVAGARAGPPARGYARSVTAGRRGRSAGRTGRGG